MGAIDRDQEGFVRSLVEAGRYGFILKFDPNADAVAAAAPFRDWVVDPVIAGDDVTAVDWGTRTVVRSRFEPARWPIHPPRAPGEKMWSSTFRLALAGSHGLLL